jgi:hypothetical protein
MHNEEPGPGFAFTAEFLKETLAAGSVDAVVMHSYNNDGGENWARPGFLGQTLMQAQTMLKATRSHSVQEMCHPDTSISPVFGTTTRRRVSVYDTPLTLSS